MVLDVYFQSSLSRNPVWFTHTTCKDNPDTSHILRCKSDLVPSGQRNGACTDGQRLTVQCGNKQNPRDQYDGQITLCSPDQPEPNTITSASFGLVSISIANVITGLNQPNNTAPLGSYEADTICRQMGYTQSIPRSAVARRAVPEYSFTEC